MAEQPAPSPQAEARAEAARAEAERLLRLREDVTRPLLARQIDDERLLLFGKFADGRFGDYAIRNENVHAIVAGLDHKVEEAPSGGLLIDVALRDRAQDFFGWMAPVVNPVGGIDYQIESIRVTRDGTDGQMAEITTRGTARPIGSEQDLEFTTRYRLRPGDTALEITTRWTNLGDKRTAPLYPSDVVYWGGALPFVPKRGFLPVTATQWYEAGSEWVAASADLDDYSVTVYSGSRAMYGRHLAINSVLRWAFETEETEGLEPGDWMEMSRFVEPGTRDFGVGVRHAYETLGFPTGQLYGRVVEVDSNIPMPNVEVRLRWIQRERGGGPRPFYRTWTNSAGEFLFDAPPGEYIIMSDAIGRRQPGTWIGTFVEPNSSTEKIHRVSIPIRFDFDVRDADTGENIPCKLTFSEPRGGKYAQLGNPWSSPFAGNTYYSLTGNGTITLPRGPFQVTASAGPEYEIKQESLVFDWKHREDPMKFEVKLKRLVPTEGYIAADIGPKTNATRGCHVTPEGRVLSALAEGVELLIPLDENVLTDLRPVVRDLGVGERLKVAGGVQFRDPKRRMPGVFSVYPIDLDTPQERIDEIAAEIHPMTDPAQVFATLREAFPEALVQTDYPTDPKVGYLARMGYKYEDNPPVYTQWKKGYSQDYDLVQVMYGRETKDDDFAQRREAWFQALFTGNEKARYTATSDSRSLIGEETGYPRMLVESSTDAPGEIDVAEIAASLREGKIVATMGPYLHFHIDEQPPGRLVPRGEDTWAYFTDLMVLSPAWAHAHNVSVERDGNYVFKGFVIGPGYPQQYPTPYDTSSIKRDRPMRDQIYTSVVEGTKTMEPVLAQTSLVPGDMPVARALSGPIFIDADHDGEFTPPIPSVRFRQR